MNNSLELREAHRGRRNGAFPRRVVLESPFAGAPRNIDYARAALRDSLERGEAPLASHLLHPQVLRDDVPADRQRGILAGHAWIPFAEALVVYRDLGISLGMRQGIHVAFIHGVPREYRNILSATMDPVDEEALMQEIMS